MGEYREVAIDVRDGGDGVAIGDAAVRRTGSGAPSCTRRVNGPNSADAAVEASLGCGNPIAERRPALRARPCSTRVRGGLDVLLARRVGPTGHAYGLDDAGRDARLRPAQRRRRGRRERRSSSKASSRTSRCRLRASTRSSRRRAEPVRGEARGARGDAACTPGRAAGSASARSWRPSDLVAFGVGRSAGACSDGSPARGPSTSTAWRGRGGSTRSRSSPRHDVADGMHAAIVRARRPPSRMTAEGFG